MKQAEGLKPVSWLASFVGVRGSKPTKGGYSGFRYRV